MIWKKASHLPEPHSIIFYSISEHEPHSYLKMRIGEIPHLPQVYQWCYEEEMKEYIDRKVKEKL